MTPQEAQAYLSNTAGDPFATGNDQGTMQAKETLWNAAGNQTSTPNGSESWNSLWNKYNDPSFRDWRNTNASWLDPKIKEGWASGELADRGFNGLSPLAMLGMFAGGIGALGGFAGLGASSLAGADASAGLLPEFGSNLAYDSIVAPEAASLAGADASAGLLPQYGTNAAYQAGLNPTSWWENALNKVSGSKDAVSALSKALSSFGSTPTIDTGSQLPSFGQSGSVASTQSTPNTLESPSLTQSALTQSPQTNSNYGFTDMTPANDNFLRAGSTWNTRLANALRSR